MSPRLGLHELETLMLVHRYFGSTACRAAVSSMMSGDTMMSSTSIVPQPTMSIPFVSQSAALSTPASAPAPIQQSLSTSALTATKPGPLRFLNMFGYKAGERKSLNALSAAAFTTYD